MENERLGLLRAAVIVFVSGLVVGVALPMLFPTNFLWTVFGPSGGDRFDWTGLLLWEAVTIVLQAIVVFGGVRLFAFRVSLVWAAVALAISTAIGFALALAIGYVTISTTAEDQTGIAGAAFGGLFVPLVLAIGILLPAFLIDSGSTPERGVTPAADAPYPPYPPYPSADAPYPPYPAPPEPR